ncbi:DUF6019 family protein [Clostridium massiliamazoniense]|uniref:DUF6019 family protein n=1 Tax=Clostridium massiliamazoniense TaxID=1347366 RepID=UPI0006D811C0|nr:DUF6019 family protein [Clostridium massiliamazoniense]
MWEELGISSGTALIILIALYLIIKWAVKNGIKEAYTDITGNETDKQKKINQAINMYAKTDKTNKDTE